MSRFKNPSVIAQGMLAPSGYNQTGVDPFVQSTARPAGALLAPSPGYDSVRVGKNRFQGKGPTGGFRRMEFAEDIGGTGATLAITPGDTASIAASEWLPEDPDSLTGGMVIADRTLKPGFAQELHEGLRTIPDMGDRDPSRPLSRSQWLYNPIGMFRKDFQESPAITVGATVALVILLHVLATDAERQYRGYRGRGVTAATVGVPAAAVSTGGEETSKAVNDIVGAADTAVKRIEQAAEGAVNAITDTANKAAEKVVPPESGE